MSQSSPPATSQPAAKARNPVERAIVWGVIVIGLVAVACEAGPWYQHRKVLDDLKKSIDQAEVSDSSVKKSDVATLLGGKQPDRVESLAGRNIANGAKTVEIYKWFTINPGRPRELYVYYGHEVEKGKQAESGNPDLIAFGAIPAQTAEEAFAENPSEKPAPTPPIGAMSMQGSKDLRPPGGGAPGGDAAAKPDDGEQSPADDSSKPADDKTADEPSKDEKPDETPEN